MNVIDCLDSAVVAAPDRPALIEGLGSRRRSMTFCELQQSVDGAVACLRASGLAPGSRVLLAVPFSADMTVALLAVLKAGMVAMFIDPAHGAAQVARCLRAQPPAAAIAGPVATAAGLLFPETRSIPLRFSLRGPRGLLGGAPASGSQSTERRSPEDSALLTFTSGSMGKPKGVVRTHGFLLRQFAMIDRIADIRAGDIDFVAMPMFVLFNLGRQITSVLPACDVRRPGQADPELAWLQLRAESATRIVASPAFLARLAGYCELRGKTLPILQRISTGGGPVPPLLPDRLTELAPNARVVSVYGSTEAEPIASLDSRSVSITDLRLMQEGSGLLVGYPVPGCAVRIMADLPARATRSYSHAEFDALATGVDCIGEIVVSGPHVLPGYADAARNTEAKLDVDGERWHRTGDAGYLDRRGRLWLVGRCSAAIRDRRGEIYPFQVEFAAEAVPGTRRAALLAVDGQRVLAIETRRRSIDCARIALCVTRQAIDRVVLVRRIPVDRRHNSKIDYTGLRRALERRLPGLGMAVYAIVASTCRSCVCLWRRLHVRWDIARLASSAGPPSQPTVSASESTSP